MEERPITKPPVVILSSINWDYLRQRHQILGTCFAESGHRVIFVEGLAFGSNYLSLSYYAGALGKLWRKVQSKESISAKRNLPQNLYVYLSLVAPLRPRIFRWINKRIFVPRVLGDIARMGIRNPVVWSFQPTDTALQVARGLEPKALIYDCVANYAYVQGAPRDISETERKWLAVADLAFVDSSYLRKRHKDQRPDLIQLPPGVDYQLFSQAYSPRDPSEPIRRVCFYGGMGENWFDFALVQDIADAGFRVSLIGYKDEQSKLSDHPNIEHSPPVPQTQLPALLKSMDALLLPYKVNEFTRGVFPSKVYECLATGKPVVATPLPDLQGELARYIYLANDAGEFIDVLRQLPEVETQAKTRMRMTLARNNSWQSRFDLISQELGRLLDA